MNATLRRLAELAVTPLVPSDYLDLLDPLRAGAPLRARVVGRRAETRDAVTLVLKPGRGWRGHVPGQWVRVGVDVDGVRHWRAYSVTSRPGEALTITVKAIPDGLVSNHLVRRARPGMLLQLDQATGDFTLASSPSRDGDGEVGRTSRRKLLFVTGGSGITPVMGMLRSHALADAVLVHSAPTADDVVFGGELRAMARDHRVRLVELHTDTDGMLSTERLADLVPDLDERLVYACGPTGMLEVVEALVPDVVTERFRATVVEPGDGGAISFTKSDTVIATDGATTILDAGEAAGVLMPSGCRMGICFGCVLPLKEGAVRDLRNGTVTTAGDGVLVQTCVSAAAGACDLEI
jgi:ferredoxin-NADP reductase